MPRGSVLPQGGGAKWAWSQMNKCNRIYAHILCVYDEKTPIGCISLLSYPTLSKKAPYTVHQKPRGIFDSPNILMLFEKMIV